MSDVDFHDSYLWRAVANEDCYEGDQEGINLDDFEIVESSRPQGEKRFVGRHIPSDRYFRFSVPYDSWAGTEWGDMDGPDEVEPYQVMVTKYRPKGTA